MIKDKDILDVLNNVKDPELGVSIVKLGMVKKVEVENDKVFIEVELTTPACPLGNQIEKSVKEAVTKAYPNLNVEVKLSAKTTSRLIAPEDILPTVKNVIAIASGKGGVGKTTLACNLALALSKFNVKVGLLDGDIYGPSIPTMLKINEPVRSNGVKLIPPISHNIKVMSIGFFITEDTPLIWRGPILANVLRQMIMDVDWGELDYLIVDLPPGTGDVPLTLAQTLPLTGVIIVTTPQDAAVKIASKALTMFKKLNVEILGVVENMSYYLCEKCGNKNYIFGSEGAREMAKKYNVSFLGEIPFDPEIRIRSDEGKLALLFNSESPSSKAYINLAMQVAARVSVINYSKYLSKKI